jgi:trimeric autotransporter adhesin
MRRYAFFSLIMTACATNTTALSEQEERIAALEATLAETQAALEDLQQDLSSVATTGVVSDVDERLSALESDHLTAADATPAVLLDLASYLSVDLETNAIVLRGANVYVQSGSGVTYEDQIESTGLGNLIIGYALAEDSNVRTGSHNLVVGDYHSWTGWGGVVAGWNNNIEGFGSSVHGGAYNTAGGWNASVLGGLENAGSGSTSTVSGGARNTASGEFSTVSGGGFNVVGGYYAGAAGFGLTSVDNYTYAY